jgi:hypothetical protein
MNYYQTRKLEKQKLNKILNDVLDPLITSDMDRQQIVVLFNINNYSDPYDSTITIYYDKQFDLPKKIGDVEIKQILKLKCRNCLSVMLRDEVSSITCGFADKVMYPACFCGAVPSDIYDPSPS